MKYRKRIEVVDAEQWVPGQNDEILKKVGLVYGDYALIPTTGDDLMFHAGDWVIDRSFTCHDRLFHMVYEPHEG